MRIILKAFSYMVNSFFSPFWLNLIIFYLFLISYLTLSFFMVIDIGRKVLNHIVNFFIDWINNEYFGYLIFYFLTISELRALVFLPFFPSLWNVRGPNVFFIFTTLIWIVQSLNLSFDDSPSWILQFLQWSSWFFFFILFFMTSQKNFIIY